MKIKPDKPLNFNNSSLFQGVLMENIPSEYADYLHNISVLPYSQSLEIIGDEYFWIINTLTQQAKEQIIDVLLEQSFDKFTLKHNTTQIEIVEKNIESISYNDLLDKYYLQNNSKKFIRIRFYTCTSFKSQGEYMIFPDLRLIFQSLINKFNANCDCYVLEDENLLEDIISACSIIGYKLSSNKFELEGHKIPSFIGEIMIKVKSNSIMLSLINMLLDFSTYSGIGIKCGVGMGHIKIANKEK